MVRARNIVDILLITLHIILLVAGSAFFRGAVYLKSHGSAGTVCLNNGLTTPFLVTAGVLSTLVSVVGLIVICCYSIKDIDEAGNSLCIGIYKMVGMVHVVPLFLIIILLMSSDVANSEDFDDFNNSPSALQGSCCMPPRECGFEYINATFWTVPTAIQDQMKSSEDCRKWSNKQNELCFNCKTCNIGIQASVIKQLRNLVILFLVLVSFIIILNITIHYRTQERSQIHPEQDTIPII